MPATSAIPEMPVVPISGNCDFESGSGVFPDESDVSGSGLNPEFSGSIVHIETCRSHPLRQLPGKIHMIVKPVMPGALIRDSFEIDANLSKSIG